MVRTFAIVRETGAGGRETLRAAAESAIETFRRIIQRKPDFPEGWNKRATLYYLIGEYDKSLADCEEVIRRNPVHFGALSGFGMIYLQLGKPEQALDYFPGISEQELPKYVLVSDFANFRFYDLAY